MDVLQIVDHHEWWITYENKEGEHGHRCATAFNEGEAKAMLSVFREEAKDGEIYECQKILVHRTAEKLDW